MTHERAVSEILGYVLVIAIVTIMIATVMTIGVSGLYDTQRSEQTNNMERAFDVLADNLAHMYVGEAPSRATEIRLLAGHLRYDDDVVINVTVDGNLVENLTISTAPIIYDNEANTVIAYEAGAVVRQDGDQSVMLTEPPISIGDGRTIVPMVRTRGLSGTPNRMDGPGTVLIRGDGLRVTRVTTTVEADATPINVTVDTSRTDAWESYFTDLNVTRSNVTVDNDRVQLTLTRDQGYVVTVVQQRIRISLQD